MSQGTPRETCATGTFFHIRWADVQDIFERHAPNCTRFSFAVTCLLTGTLFLFWQQRKDYEYDKAEFSVHLETVLPTPLEVSEDCTAVYHLHLHTTPSSDPRLSCLMLWNRPKDIVKVFASFTFGINMFFLACLAYYEKQSVCTVQHFKFQVSSVKCQV